MFLSLRRLRSLFCIFCLGSFAGAGKAAPFSSCLSEAFLVQGASASLYSVNLVTGYYKELSSDMGVTGKINAIGFNFHDNYLYGFSYDHKNIVKIGSDYTVVPLQAVGLPNVSFFVGDISLRENSYYMYRSGSAYGLYRINLDTSAANYLDVEKIIDGELLSLRIYDFAFHPDNGNLYSVDAGGNLLRIDPATGASSNLGNVGESGTFGAVYFDADEYLYISRNSDGLIFRINLSQVNPQAELFAYGPASSNNDGARCASAAIVDEQSQLDFANAPESYGTSLANNGPRHEAMPDMYIGSNVGGLDDGVNFVTGFEVGLDALINVEVTGEGVVNLWADWDQDGVFEEAEQAIRDRAVAAGPNVMQVAVPPEAGVGSTWARIRYSSTAGLGPLGGGGAGEVQDHTLRVTPAGTSIVSYPSDQGYVTLAYEDNWPLLGDYDFNDVVLAYRTRRYINASNQVGRFDIEGYVLAANASFHNGFAVQFDGIRTDNIDASAIYYKVNGEYQERSPLEENAAADDAVILVLQNVRARLAAQQRCESGCVQPGYVTFYISIPLVQPVAADTAPAAIFNPFIFAASGHYHGEVFASSPGRSLEIHLKNKAYSSRFEQGYLARYDDSSNSLGGTYFHSKNNMPWAIEVPILWSPPVESVDISKAYPLFPKFVESSGKENTTWYQRANGIASRIVNQ